MRGEKQANGFKGKWTILSDWKWVDPTYTLNIPKPIGDIKSISIDSSELLADIDRKNNSITIENGIQFILDNR